ncbi:MAG: energy transducer TonB [Verrucomicrobiota bacterium]
MTHAIEGWTRAHAPAHPAHPIELLAGRRRPATAQPGLWKYQSVNRSRRGVYALSIFISIGLHAFALLGFNYRPPPKKTVLVDDGPLIQMVMPDLDDEEEKPVEALDDSEAMEAPAISVPMLADIPTIVPVNAFVQPLDFTPVLEVDPNSVRLSAIPVNIARGSGQIEKLGKIFDVSQLDRQPQALFQPAPIFPMELKNDFTESSVTLEFIINTRGEVLMPKVLSSRHRRFEEAAITGVLKWKFKPGYKGGRAVNTRTQITIMFRVTAGE